MNRIRTYITKSFIDEYRDGFLEAYSKAITEPSKFEKYIAINELLGKSEWFIDLTESDINELIRNPKYEFIKKEIKKNSGAFEDRRFNLEHIKNRDGQFFFQEENHRVPFQLFLLPNDWPEKKIRKYKAYYGYEFLQGERIENLSVDKHYGVGSKKLDAEQLYQDLNIFNSLILIDPYLLEKSDNTSQQVVIGFLKEIISKTSKANIYIDLITSKPKPPSKFADDKGYNILKEKFANHLREIQNEYNIPEIRHKIHTIQESIQHDRTYIGNTFIATFGHGLEALKDRKDSEIRIDYLYSRQDNNDFIGRVKDKLKFYKGKIEDVGDNPIWKIIEE